MSGVRLLSPAPPYKGFPDYRKPFFYGHGALVAHSMAINHNKGALLLVTATFFRWQQGRWGNVSPLDDSCEPSLSLEREFWELPAWINPELPKWGWFLPFSVLLY